MQSNDKSSQHVKSGSNEATVKWSSKKSQNKASEQTVIDMKGNHSWDQMNNSSKTSPNKSIHSNKSNDKKTTNNGNNKRTKGPLNQIKARLNLNASPSKASISCLRPTHVFADHSHSDGQSCSRPVFELADGIKSGLRGQECSGHGVHHSFISDITDVRQMENTLLTLLDDFHSGRLQAFGQDITFEKMESVREQQERLARLHFDLNLQQEVYGHQSEEGKRLAKDNMTKLIENLQQLSNSIEQLQSRSTGANTGS